MPSQPAAAIVHCQRTHHRGHGQPEKLRRHRRRVRQHRHAGHSHGGDAFSGEGRHQPVPARQRGADRAVARNRGDRQEGSGPRIRQRRGRLPCGTLRQPAHQPGHRRPLLRHPHRTAGRRSACALPHRRRAPRVPESAESHDPRRDQPHQGHVRYGYRRAP